MAQRPGCELLAAGCRPIRGKIAAILQGRAKAAQHLRPARARQAQGKFGAYGRSFSTQYPALISSAAFIGRSSSLLRSPSEPAEESRSITQVMADSA